MNQFIIYFLYAVAILGIGWNGFLCGIAFKEITDRNELRQVLVKRGALMAVLITVVAARVFV